MIKEIINSDTPFSNEIVYLDGEKVVGSLKYSLIYERIEIDNIIVEPPYRNNKIGSKLMEYLINVARKNKVLNITLEVRKSNFIAIKLYKKYGFNEVAIRKFYYGDEDAILMEKKVI